ncbi:MAG: hypothetical protein RL518_2073 [Pseudomonadota bacterium]
MRRATLLKLVAVSCVAMIMVLRGNGIIPTAAQPVLRGPEGGGSKSEPPLAQTPTPTPTIEQCIPKDCNGHFVVSSYDVNRDCLVTDLDADIVGDYVEEQGGPVAVTPDNKHMDVNGDELVTTLDRLTILFYQYKTGCSDDDPTPTPTATPTATATPSFTATPTATPTPTLSGGTPCVPLDCHGNAAPAKYDVKRDCKIDENDPKQVTNYLNQNGGGAVKDGTRHLDVNGDGWISPLDVLFLVDFLNNVGCSPTPTPKPTLTPTPTATPTPKCEFVKANLKMFGYDATGVVDSVYTGMTQGSSCVSSMMTELSKCVGREKSGGYKDDWYALCFARLYLNGRDSRVGDLGGGARCNRVTSTPGEEDWTKWWHHISGDPNARYCLDGYIYLRMEPDPKTGSCRATGTPPDPLVCGNFNVNFIKSSPISLLWERGVGIDDKVSVVRFPIDPAHPNNFVGWKASEKTPLLVYDPEHTGTITRAAQLFGNWTFGGKQLASLDPSAVSDTAWADGFEALATLDRDGNGKVDKEELAPLALWFDRDQDGVSDKGEVVPVSQVGVVALYYNTSRTTSGRDIHLKVGFERMVDGRLVSGGAVDWYGGHAESKFEVLGHHLLGKVAAPPTAPDSLNLPNEREDSSVPHGAVTGRNPFAGMWEWKFDENTSEPPGHLILSGAQAEPSVVQGYSMVTMPFATAPSPELGSLVTFYFVKGHRSDEGNLHKMTFRSDFGKSRTENEATLSADGKSMTGKTKAYIAENGATREVTYTWSAKKIGQP